MKISFFPYMKDRQFRMGQGSRVIRDSGSFYFLILLSFAKKVLESCWPQLFCDLFFHAAFYFWAKCFPFFSSCLPKALAPEKNTEKQTTPGKKKIHIASLKFLCPTCGLELTNFLEQRRPHGWWAIQHIENGYMINSA